MVWFFFLDGKDGKEKNNDNNAPHSPEENKRCICQKLRRFSVLDLGQKKKISFLIGDAFGGQVSG